MAQKKLKGIDCLINFSLFWGQRHLLVDWMDHFSFFLRHPLARPKVMQPDTQLPLHDKDKTSQPQCQHVDNRLIDHLLIPHSFTLPAPLPHPPEDSLTKYKHLLTLALNSLLGRCSFACLYPNQVHSVTPTLLIMRTTKESSLSWLGWRD